MGVRGPLSHVDLSVSDPDRAIPFYAALLEGLGFRRWRSDHPDFAGERPRRAAWFLLHADRSVFGIEVRPAAPGSRARPHDRYAPGLHHMAFHAESPEAVDEVHARVVAAGGAVLDAPADYSGKPGYSEGYYAAFFADPDGVKLEVVHEPLTNPGAS
jgi:glyoxylase I family protein